MVSKGRQHIFKEDLHHTNPGLESFIDYFLFMTTEFDSLNNSWVESTKLTLL